MFADGATEYIPVCLPAFRPDRCIREDDSERAKNVSAKLKELHSNATQERANSALAICADADPDILYHMCLKADWEAAKEKGEAYYPPTFEQDGNYTHATDLSYPKAWLQNRKLSSHFWTEFEFH